MFVFKVCSSKFNLCFIHTTHCLVERSSLHTSFTIYRNCEFFCEAWFLVALPILLKSIDIIIPHYHYHHLFFTHIHGRAFYTDTIAFKKLTEGCSFISLSLFLALINFNKFQFSVYFPLFTGLSFIFDKIARTQARKTAINW